MSSHMRVLLFCVSLLAAPVLWDLGLRLGGEVVGFVVPAAVVGAAAVYAQLGQTPPPTGPRQA